MDQNQKSTPLSSRPRSKLWRPLLLIAVGLVACVLTAVMSSLSPRDLPLIAVVLVACAGTFFWGVATIRYQVFPFTLLQSAKHSAVGGGLSPYHRSHKSLFEADHGPQDIVLLGDSLTDWGDDFLEAEYPKYSVRNMGIAGDTAGGILDRVDAVIACKPKRVFVMVGINDINRRVPMDDIFRDYSRIISTLQDKGIAVYVQSTLYTSDYGLRHCQEGVTDLNRRLVEYCLQKKAVFIDLNLHLAPNQQLKDEFTVDGTHLNAVGYHKWAEVLKAHLGETQT